MNPNHAVELSSTLVAADELLGICRFTQMGVCMPPGLVIKGEVIAVGKVLTADDIHKKTQQRR
jgi:hypothetical protein